MNGTLTRVEEIEHARTIDTEVARLWDGLHEVNDRLNRNADALAKSIENRTSSWYREGSYNWDRNEERIVKLEAAIEADKPLVEAARKVVVDYDKANYGGWSRFFLVKHIHSSMHCSSFRITTRIGWLPTVSGLTEREAVAEHGETLCTICFPSAPTELTQKAVDPNICTQGRDYDGFSRSGYVSGNYGTCKCGQRVAMTTTGKLRKHKVVGA